MNIYRELNTTSNIDYINLVIDNSEDDKVFDNIFHNYYVNEDLKLKILDKIETISNKYDSSQLIFPCLEKIANYSDSINIIKKLSTFNNHKITINLFNNIHVKHSIIKQSYDSLSGTQLEKFIDFFSKSKRKNKAILYSILNDEKSFYIYKNMYVLKNLLFKNIIDIIFSNLNKTNKSNIFIFSNSILTFRYLNSSNFIF